jgi:PPOX class probable F420-dependent enzyme
MTMSNYPEGSPERSGAGQARRTAHPVAGRRIPGAKLTGVLGSRTQPADARRLTDVPRTQTIDSFTTSRHGSIVSFRRDGRAVPTPVWVALADGHVYVRSERASGKVRRLRRDPRALVAPCTRRGQPTGAPLEMIARVLPPAEEQIGESALKRRFGFGRELFELTMDVMRVDMCYLELTPEPWDEAAGERRARSERS